MRHSAENPLRIAFGKTGIVATTAIGVVIAGHVEASQNNDDSICPSSQEVGTTDIVTFERQITNEKADEISFLLLWNLPLRNWVEQQRGLATIDVIDYGGHSRVGTVAIEEPDRELPDFAADPNYEGSVKAGEQIAWSLELAIERGNSTSRWIVKDQFIVYVCKDGDPQALFSRHRFVPLAKGEQTVIEANPAPPVRSRWRW